MFVLFHEVNIHKLVPQALMPRISINTPSSSLPTLCSRPSLSFPWVVRVQPFRRTSRASISDVASVAFDQDINAKAAMAFPQLYIRGIRGLEYTRLRFLMYMLDGLYQSLVVFFVPYFVWTIGPPLSWNGRAVESIADLGTTIAVAAIWAANTYVGLNTH